MGLRFVLLALSVVLLAFPLVHAEEGANAAPAVSNTRTGIEIAKPAATARETPAISRKTPTVSEAVKKIHQQSVEKLPGQKAQVNAAAKTSAQKSGCELTTNSEEKAKCLRSASATAQNAVTARNAVAVRSNYGSALVECKNLTDAEGRVRCRLAAASSEKNANAAIVHVPEECKLKTDNSSRSQCFEKYEKHLKCASEATSEGRSSCLQRELGLDTAAKPSTAQCAASENRTACARQLKEHALEIASARLTSLQEAARKLSDYGVNPDEIGSFVAAMESQRSALQNAANAGEKKQALRVVQTDWNSFKEKAIATVRAARQAANAGGEAQ